MRKLMNEGPYILWEKKPWLVLGKGPSIDGYRDITPGMYNILALNHTVALGPCEIAHAIDLEVLRDCGREIEANAKLLVMPDRPHVGMTEGPPIRAHYAQWPLLLRLDNEDRLITYQKYAGRAGAAPSGTVPVMYFSGEAAFGVLAAMGVKNVSTLGIDGGTQYGTSFKDLTPLENGRKSFDESTEAILEIVRKHGMTWTKLGVPAGAKELPRG